MAFLANFQINQTQNSSVQIQKVKDWTFSFQSKKYACLMLRDDARVENVFPPLVLTRILKSCLERNDTLPREINCVAWLSKTRKTLVSKLMWKIYLLIGIRLAKEWILVFLFQTFRYFLVFCVDISVKYLVLVILG